MIRKMLYQIGVKYRNPSLLPYLDFLKQTDKWNIEQLKEYQFSRCKEFLCFVQKYSSFYKDCFLNISFNPLEMKDINELKRIPMIDKKVLLINNKEIHTNYSFDRLFFSETSGTSGQVLKFWRNEEWDSHNRAAMFRGYSWYGVEPWDRNGYFWGYNIDKKQRLKTLLLDELQNRFRLFSYDKKHIVKFISKLESAVFLSGYSSMIYEVSKIINHLEMKKDFNLKMIKGTSEKIYNSYHDSVKQAFGIKIISEYGSAESGLIAFECPEGGHMHINMENVIVEEEDGEIVVTNLLSYSFPIIRYKLGDLVKIAPENFKCSCGRAHPVVLDILGRVGKNIVGNNFLYPSLTFYYVFKNLALNKGITLNYQAHQNEKGKVLIKIEQNKPEYTLELNNELEKYFHNDITFTIEWGKIFHTKNEKLKDFITTLN